VIRYEVVDDQIEAMVTSLVLLEDLQVLRDQADLGGRRLLLTAMLDADYIDTIEKKGVVSFQPKATFMALFTLANDREGLEKSGGRSRYPDVSAGPCVARLKATSAGDRRS
jgi:hypothetical protein